MECVFCDIARKKIPADIVLENDTVIAFKDIHPSAPVHILAVPKEHIQSIRHLEGNHKEIIAELIYAAKQAAQDAGLQGYKLVFNVGRGGGQIIDHLHLHILGGWKTQKDLDETSARSNHGIELRE